MDQVALLVREGGEFVVNTVTEGTQFSPRLARLANGGFVVTWTDFGGSDGNGAGVKAQVYNAAGAKVGGEISVNTVTAGNQEFATVSGLAAGGFVINWRSGAEPGTTNVGIGKLQIFDVGGNKVGGEIDHALSSSAIVFSAGLANGGFVLTKRGGTGQIFDATGNAVGAQFTVAAGSVNASTVAATLSDGRFVVAFDKSGGPWFQLFSASGEKIGAEVYAGHFSSTVGALSVTALTTGGFVLHWLRASGDAADPDGAIKAQVFDASGAAVGGLIHANTTIEGFQQSSRGAALPGGGFMLTWTSIDTSATGFLPSVVQGQVFDATGRKLGSEFDVSVETDHALTNHGGAELAHLGDGRIVAVWSGSGPGDTRPDPAMSAGGIRAQFFSPLSIANVDAAVSDSTFSEIAMGGVAVAVLSGVSPAVNGENFTFTYLSDTAGGAFTVRDGKLVVADNRKLDFETAPTVSVTIRVSDGAGNSTDEVIQLSIADSLVETRYAAGGERHAKAGAQTQEEPAIARLSTGGFVLVWAEGFPSDVRGRLYDSAGNAVSSDFLVNSVTDWFQGRPAVTGLANGAFAVTWTDQQSNHVKLQLFSASTAKVGGEVVITSAPHQHSVESTVTSLVGGGLVVTWTGPSATGGGVDSGTAIRALLLDAAGNKVGGEFVVNANPAGYHVASAVAALPGGGFVVTWTDGGFNDTPSADGSDVAVLAQRFDASGNKVGPEIIVNTTVLGTQGNSSVAAAPDGSYLIAWTHLDAEGEPAGIRGQRFDASGVKVGGEIVIDGGPGILPHVTVRTDGTYVVTFTTVTPLDPGTSSVVAQFVSPAGLLVGDPFLVNAVTAGSQYDPSAALLLDGSLAIAWRTDGAETGQAIKLRLFADASRPAALADLFVTNEATPVAGNLFADNGSGPDGGSGYQVVAINGSAANVGQSILLSSGARATVNADGSISIDPTGASWLPAASSGALSQITDGFTYTLTGGSTATVSVRVTGLASPDDEFRGTTAFDTIVTRDVADLIKINQVNATTFGGFDSVNARGGDDVIYTGVGIPLETAIDGGAGYDVLMVRSGSYQFRGRHLTNIEAVVVRSGTASVFGEAPIGARNATISFNSDFAFAGRSLVVDATDLTQSETLTFTSPLGVGTLVVTGGAGSDTITGGDGADVLNGGAGNDTLRGSEAFGAVDGVDILRGGAGDDVYWVSGGDLVEENAGEGFDEVVALTTSYTLSANVEKLRAGRSGSTLTGNDLANTIIGNFGNDIIDGGAGADVMEGLSGHDIYYVDNAGDQVVEDQFGNDANEIRTTLPVYTLNPNMSVDNLTGLSATGQVLTGHAGSNIITGGAGNDVISGGGGPDRLRGGAGDDLYHVVTDSASEVIEEDVGAGTDEVRTARESYTLAANVENLTGTSANRQFLTGNALANLITGGAGWDVIDGGAGADTMRGGAGDDLYTVDDAGDMIVEEAGQGTDEVRTALAFYSLADQPNVENILGLSSAPQTLIGNAGNNVIRGFDGEDVIDGGGGIDQIDAGTGNDTLKDSDLSGAGLTLLDGNEGFDTLDLSGHSANLSIVGTSDIFQRFEIGGTTRVIGVERIIGGAGDDVIDMFIYPANIEVMAGGGHDIVQGSDDGFDKLFGEAGNDILRGFDGNDTLDGGAGSDLLDGGAGADAMTGGLGDDVYIVGEAGDTVVENANEGSDEVRTSLAAFSIAGLANIESLSGIASFGQTLTGNASGNIVTGSTGDDVLTGGAGNDRLVGGAGADRFVYLAASDSMGPGDFIADFASGSDKIDLSALGRVQLTFSATSNPVIGAYTLLTVTVGAATMEIRVGGSLVRSDVIAETGIVGTAGDDILDGTADADEILGLGGNDTLRGFGANDILNGGTGNDLLDGGAGADAMTGGTGDDVYLVDDAGDTIVENANEGSDEVRTGLAAFSIAGFAHAESLTGTAAFGQALTGNALDNVLTGSTGDDVLTGGAGHDRIVGGAGADRFVYLSASDSTGPGDYIVGFVDGVDKIDLSALGRVRLAFSAAFNPAIGHYTLLTVTAGAATMEIRVDGSVPRGDVIADTSIAGTSGDDLVEGTAAADEIYGLAGDDTLRGFGANDMLDGGAGNDLLDGGLGADIMTGGTGDDIYLVDEAGDTIVEAANGGTDEMRTALADATIAANVEILTGTFGAGQTLRGDDAANRINGGGGNDAILAGGGNDLLDGGAGADVMTGGLGNDIFVVDDAGDQVIEAAGEGTDEIRTFFATYSLAGLANVENLTGAAGAQTLTGNDAANVIDGGTGADAMTGGLGDDTYVVDQAGDVVTELAGEGIDTVRSAIGSRTDYTMLYVLPDHVENFVGTAVAGQGVHGNAGDNVMTMGAGNDLIVMDGGGIDSVFGGGGNDYLYYGATLDAQDQNDGGAGFDTIGLLGVYELTLEAGTLTGIEKLVMYSSGDAAFPNSYAITTLDANVAAGQILQVVALGLKAGENLAFFGHAETDGGFNIQSGAGDDILVGGRRNDSISGGGGNDLIYALNGDDQVQGGAGDDMIYGGGGNDRLAGGAGRDLLNGGFGDDVFVYAAPGDSTGTGHDVIHVFDARIDRIDLATDAAWNGSVAAGTLSDATFDADLAAAVDGLMQANGAVLFTPDAGDRAGRSFAVIDANGDGAYSAGADYVIEFTSPLVPLTGIDIFV